MNFPKVLAAALSALVVCSLVAIVLGFVDLAFDPESFFPVLHAGLLIVGLVVAGVGFLGAAKRGISTNVTCGVLASLLLLEDIVMSVYLALFAAGDSRHDASGVYNAARATMVVFSFLALLLRTASAVLHFIIARSACPKKAKAAASVPQSPPKSPKPLAGYLLRVVIALLVASVLDFAFTLTWGLTGDENINSVGITFSVLQLGAIVAAIIGIPAIRKSITVANIVCAFLGIVGSVFYFVMSITFLSFSGWVFNSWAAVLAFIFTLASLGLLITSVVLHFRLWALIHEQQRSQDGASKTEENSSPKGTVAVLAAALVASIVCIIFTSVWGFHSDENFQALGITFISLELVAIAAACTGIPAVFKKSFGGLVACAVLAIISAGIDFSLLVCLAVFYSIDFQTRVIGRVAQVFSEAAMVLHIVSAVLAGSAAHHIRVAKNNTVQLEQQPPPQLPVSSEPTDV